MKARFFNIDTSHLPAVTPNIPILQTLTIPGLSAYAIDHADLQYNGATHAIDGIEFVLEGDTINSTNRFEFSDQLRIAVYHYGIRDYSLLFPEVRALDRRRAARMGCFYEEAEKNFDQGCWLSFMLMCGGIFEHMLYSKLHSPDENALYALSRLAFNSGIIDQSQLDDIDKIRHARNTIHCNKIDQDYITRAEALDIRVSVEKLMLKI